MQARTHRSKTCTRPPAEEAEGGPGTEAGGGEEGGGGEEAEEAGGEGVPPWWLRHGVGAGRIIARHHCKAVLLSVAFVVPPKDYELCVLQRVMLLRGHENKWGFFFAPMAHLHPGGTKDLSLWNCFRQNWLDNNACNFPTSFRSNA